jgi:hypothetical protein
MRYAAIVAMPLFCALTGCANLRPSSSAATPAAAVEQPTQSPEGAAPIADDHPTAPPPASATDSSRAGSPSSASGNVTQPSSQPSAPTASSSQSRAANTAKPKAASTPQKSGNPSPAPLQASAGKARVAPPTTVTGPQSDSSAPQPQALDLASLEQRLKDTRAIGVFTKLSLKNQVDELLSQVKAFHGGKLPPSLGDLRQRYDLLLMKVLSLLHDGDPSLAKAISSSREAIWDILSDPQKFSKI